MDIHNTQHTNPKSFNIGLNGVRITHVRTKETTNPSPNNLMLCRKKHYTHTDTFTNVVERMHIEIYIYKILWASLSLECCNKRALVYVDTRRKSEQSLFFMNGIKENVFIGAEAGSFQKTRNVFTLTSIHRLRCKHTHTHFFFFRKLERMIL